MLSLLAGTDNSDKNTYYKIDPYAVSIPQDNEFASWFANQYGKDFDFSAIHQVEMDGDDMDSILRTNNNSHQTKPYYIDRLHPYADDAPTECLYEGMNNQLFNFVERAYEGTHELSAVMNEIMIAATELITDEDVKNGLVGGKSLWGFFNKYFFNVQRYFPQIAYLEQARIRYEFPELLGYISSGGGARSIRPITQSLGSQLQNELQYVNQRVIYMTSYAGFGAWGGDTTHSIGLADANETFGFMPAALPDGSAASYTFTIKPHQYIYPSFYEGQTFTQTHKRTSPKKTCTFSFTQNYTSGDTGVGICGVNYISDLGDLGNVSITTAMIINGKRLTKIETTQQQRFRPTSISINAFNCTRVNIRGFTNNVDLDCSKLIRATFLSNGGYLRNIILPESSNLTGISYAGAPTEIEMRNIPNLKTLSFAVETRKANITKIHVGENVGTNTEFSIQKFVKTVYTQQVNKTRKLQHIHVENMDWTGVDVDILNWLSDSITCELYGRIGIAEGTNEYQTAVTWDLKNKFIKKFGDIDTGNGNLTLEYRKRNFEASTAKIKGNFFVDDYIVRDKGYNDVETFDFSVTPESTYMNTQTKIQFSLEGGNTSAYSMSADGKLSVNVYQLSEKQNFATIKAAVTQYENGSFVTENVTKKIEIWNRPAQLGDVVYYDGSYSSVDNFDDIGKSAIGICFFTAPRYPNGTIVDAIFNPNDVQQRFMVCLSYIRTDIAAETRGGNDRWVWGIKCWEESADTNNLFTTDSNGVNHFITKDGKLLDNTGKKYYTSQFNVTDESFRSEADELSILNNGFKPIEANTLGGLGLAYLEKGDDKQYRTLKTDNDWVSEVSDYYKGLINGVNMVNHGYAETLKVIHHRNSYIVGDGTSLIDNFVDNNGRPMDIHLYKPSEGNGFSEVESLANCIDNVVNYFKNEYGDSYPKRWRSLLYPIISAAYAYEPKVNPTENLSNKFKKHNWFLSSPALLGRIGWYLNQGEDNPNNIFSKALKKGLMQSFYLWGTYPTAVEYLRHTSISVRPDNGRISSTGKTDGWFAIPTCAF